MWTWEADGLFIDLTGPSAGPRGPSVGLKGPSFSLRNSYVGLKGPFAGLSGPMLRSTIQVGPLSAQESNLSLWEGLCCSKRAPCRYVPVLNWPDWTQEIILPARKGLMLPSEGSLLACREPEFA